jgi:hypothetical protein
VRLRWSIRVGRLVEAPQRLLEQCGRDVRDLVLELPEAPYLA